MKNILVYILGGSLETKPLQPGLEDVREHSEKMVTFSKPIRSIWDIFRDDTFDFSYSEKIVEWQAEQASTHEFRYDGRPRICMVPPKEALQSHESKTRVSEQGRERDRDRDSDRKIEVQSRSAFASDLD